MDDDEISRQLADRGVDPARVAIVVPYIEGMLRDETLAAVAGWGGTYTTWPLMREEPHDYAKAFMCWWDTRMDTMIIEQDMVPTTEQILAMLACPEPWCVRPYHVGEGQFTTGLGMCKISARLKAHFPSAARLATRSPGRAGGLVDWRSLNEAVTRQLTRYIGPAHTHPGIVEHLHYPKVIDDA